MATQPTTPVAPTPPMPSPSVFTISVEPLTEEAFAPFGQVLAEGDALLELRNGEEFHLNVLHYRRRPLVVDYVNRHHNATQALIPLGGRPALVAVAAPEVTMRTAADVAEVRVFLLDGTAGINLGLGTWHWGPVPLGDEVRLVNFQGKGWPTDSEGVHLARDLGVTVNIALS